MEEKCNRCGKTIDTEREGFSFNDGGDRVIYECQNCHPELKGSNAPDNYECPVCNEKEKLYSQGYAEAKEKFNKPTFIQRTFRSFLGFID